MDSSTHILLCVLPTFAGIFSYECNFLRVRKSCDCPGFKSKNFGQIFKIKKLTIGFIVGILTQGVLDYLPHSYPFRSRFYIVFAFLLFVVGFIISQRQNKLLVAVCFAGCIFPDVNDLGGEIVNKHQGIPVPHLSY